METQADSAIDVRYFALSEPLRPYFTALYRFSICCPAGLLIEDQLHPEWAVMRFTAGGAPPAGCVGEGSLRPRSPFVVSGPTSKAIRFGLQESCIWGLGLQPAGFARYVPADASDLADAIINGHNHAAFRHFAPLLEIASAREMEPEAIAVRFEHFLLALKANKVAQEDRIIACHAALRDSEVASVADLSDRVGLSRRSLERMCSRYFGFPPKMLLRRQRFLRSLAQFTVAGGGSWSRALDGQYYDQAHFVRDFRAFMGTTPSEYSDAPHPILDPIMAQRMSEQGVLPKTDLPTLLRYAGARKED